MKPLGVIGLPGRADGFNEALQEDVGERGLARFRFLEVAGIGRDPVLGMPVQARGDDDEMALVIVAALDHAGGKQVLAPELLTGAGP